MKWIYLRAIKSEGKSIDRENLILNPNALFTFLNIKYSYQLHSTCIHISSMCMDGGELKGLTIMK